MGDEIATPPGYTAWGPFVRDNYKILRTTQADIIVAGTVLGLANLFALSAAFIAVRQTRISRRPWRSAYIWMIWLELIASVVLSIICMLFLLRKIRPSFYFYMGILLCWVIQIQVLPQIIVNRIRVILMDRKRARRLSVGTAVVITLINISVFIIWMPARLQINERWIRINTIWDRTEKVLFLLLDGYLNWYFIRTVKNELIRNGLSKYNRLVRFNKRIIVVSLLCDVLIIGAMSIPNGFVYAIFHPLAYLIKLNIEMSMAHLIRAIALANPNTNNNRTPSVASKSSNEVNPFNTDIFGEVAMTRRTFFRGLFSNDQNFSRETEESTLQQDSAHSTKTPESGLESSELQSIKKSDSGIGDEPHRQQASIVDAIRSGDDCEEFETSNSVQDIRIPEPVASPSWTRDRGRKLQ